MAGLLFVLSGPSGVGKTTLRARLCQDPRIVRSVSCTTRTARPGEVDGRDYFFVTPAEFDRRIASGGFLEHAKVFGKDSYGTPRAWVSERLRDGKIVILEIEVQGARQARAAGLPCFSVFVRPPSFEALADRLRGRKSEPEEAVQRRLATAFEELAATHEFDAVVVNDDLDRTVAEIRALLEKRLAGGS